MSKKPANHTNLSTFQLKGTMLAITVFEVAHFNIERLTRELTQKIKEAPEFFETIPMVLSIDKLDIPLTKIELKGLISLFKENHIQLMALRTNNKDAINLASNLELVVLPPTGAREKLIKLAANRITSEEITDQPAAKNDNPQSIIEQASVTDSLANTSIQQQLPIDETNNEVTTSAKLEVAEDETSLPKDVSSDSQTKTSNSKVDSIKQPDIEASKIISHPVRSGQQVEGLNCDLIITSNVSAGAELITDGNIHIYGTMRGRAMAGFHGNNKARVFCHKLTAELISISGVIITEEELRRHPLWNKAAQVSLENNQITISAL